MKITRRNAGVRLLLCAVFLALNAFAASAQSTPASLATDFQSWNDVQLIVPLDSEKWNAVFSLVGRFGNDLKTAVDSRIGVMITRKINSKLTVGGGYLYRYANPTFVVPKYESRFFGAAYITTPLGKKFTLSTRLMGQYDDWYSLPNAFVCEPRVTIKRRMTIDKHAIEPFASFEPVYDTRQKQFVTYREQVGFTRALNDKVSADFYYLRQDVPDRSTRPGTANGIGMSFKIRVSGSLVNSGSEGER
jgi:hypothetical protein